MKNKKGAWGFSRATTALFATGFFIWFAITVFGAGGMTTFLTNNPKVIMLAVVLFIIYLLTKK